MKDSAIDEATTELINKALSISNMKDEATKVVEKVVGLKADVSGGPGMDAALCSDGSVKVKGNAGFIRGGVEGSAGPDYVRLSYDRGSVAGETGVEDSEGTKHYVRGSYDPATGEAECAAGCRDSSGNYCERVIAPESDINKIGISAEITADAGFEGNINKVKEESVKKNWGHTKVEVSDGYEIEGQGHLGASARLDLYAEKDGMRVEYGCSRKVDLMEGQGSAKILPGPKVSIEEQKGPFTNTTVKTIENSGLDETSAAQLEEAADAKMAAAADTVMPPGAFGLAKAGWQGDPEKAKTAVVGAAFSTCAKGLAFSTLSTTSMTMVPASGLGGSLGLMVPALTTTGPGALVLLPLGVAGGWAGKKIYKKLKDL